MTNIFKTANTRYSFGSNVATTGNQGGGDKKAGFPYIVGRDHQSIIYLRPEIQSLDQLKQYRFGWRVRPARNIGRNANPQYWHMKGIPSISNP